MKRLFPVLSVFLAVAFMLSACAPSTPTPTEAPPAPEVEPATEPAPATEAAPTVEPADLVLTNGVIYTVDKDRSTVEALAVRGDTIVYVGDNAGAQELVGAETKVIDLGGKFVLPGLMDSHAHATSGVSDIYEVPLYGIGSVEEYQQTIADFLAAAPDLTALQGAGWINAVFGPKGPTAAMLDEVAPNIPAVLSSEDYHSVWVNTKALEIAGITKDTPDPKGGIIERDENGNPLGTLRESAMDLVADVIPPYTVEQYIEGLTYFQDFAHSLGLTSVYIPSLPGGNEEAMTALHDFEVSGNMTIRFPTAVGVNPEDELSAVDDLVARREAEAGGPFEVVAAKIFMDGVLEGGTAYLEEPYLHKEGNGELLWDPQKYNEVCAALDKAGVQIHVHSIGDASTRITLDGFAYAREQNGPRDSRNMVTHIQLVHPEDVQRFADLGVIAVPQPYWFVVDTYYTQAVEYVGQERADMQYPMKSFFDKGAKVASASDYPVTWPPNPMLAMELGVTRTFPEDQADAYVGADATKALWPEEDVTIEQMIESFTINGAYAVFKENEIGSLEAGKKADFVVLSQNLLEIDSKEIHNTVALLTYFEGQEVYRSEDYSE